MSAAVILVLTFLVSIVPVIELKGAIPMGIIWANQANLAFSPWAYFGAALLGSCLPTLLILPLLKPVLKAFGRTKLFAGLSTKLDAHFEKKAQKVELKAAEREKRKIQKAQESGKIFTEEEFALAEKKRKVWKEVFKYFSIFLFVAVPLPLTGCWTGSAVAVFLGCKTRYAAPCIIVGNIVAGLIIMAVTLGGSALFGITF